MTTKGNEGQSVLVTGASGGIGLELARVLAANRFSLVLLARSRDKLEDLARELEAQHGTKVTIVPADLSEPGAAQEGAAVEHARSQTCGDPLHTRPARGSISSLHQHVRGPINSD